MKTLLCREGGGRELWGRRKHMLRLWTRRGQAGASRLLAVTVNVATLPSLRRGCCKKCVYSLLQPWFLEPHGILSYVERIFFLSLKHKTFSSLANLDSIMSKKTRKNAKQSKKQTSTGTEDTVKDQSAQKNVTQTQVNLMNFGQT